MKYLIEHLEPRLYKWCRLEYKHISAIVGAENLIFMNIKTEQQRKKLSGLGAVHKESIKKLIATELNGLRLCLLDPFAPDTLSPEDSKVFDCLIFGGILGNNPPEARTSKELGSLALPSRNLGKAQMPTDNAVYTAKQIISGSRMESLKFQNDVVIHIKEGEEVILPFRYALADGKPLISAELLDHIKKKRGF